MSISPRSGPFKAARAISNVAVPERPACEDPDADRIDRHVQAASCDEEPDHE